MNPIRFTEANIVMCAPPGLQTCHDVHALKLEQAIITCWQPTPEERVRIAMGEPVWLSLIGNTMQPAWVGCEAPFVVSTESAQPEVSDESR